MLTLKPLEYTFPQNTPFGRIPNYAHKPINFLLSDNERKVFTFLACQGNGFEPQAKYMSECTGIAPGELDTICHNLEQKGFLQLWSKTVICWDTVKEYASMLKDATPPYELGVDSYWEIFCPFPHY